jgi:hypothetical protein
MQCLLNGIFAVQSTQTSSAEHAVSISADFS